MASDEIIECVALALCRFENRGCELEFPDEIGADGWSTLLSESGKDYWRKMARAAIEAMRGCLDEYGGEDALRILDRPL